MGWRQWLSNALLGAFSGGMPAACSARAASAEPYRIVGFGDSLMAGFGLDAGNGFTEKLQAALKAKGIDAEVANAGVSGDTSSGGLSRLDWSVPDGTQLVLLELGANDMLRGVTPDITEKNLDAMLSRLKERKIPVLLVGMRAAPNLGADYQAAFDGIYPEARGQIRRAALSVLPRRRRGGREIPAGRPDAPQCRQGSTGSSKRILPTLEKAIAAGGGRIRGRRAKCADTESCVFR